MRLDIDRLTDRLTLPFGQDRDGKNREWDAISCGALARPRRFGHWGNFAAPILLMSAISGWSGGYPPPSPLSLFQSIPLSGRVYGAIHESYSRFPFRRPSAACSSPKPRPGFCPCHDISCCCCCFFFGKMTASCCLCLPASHSLVFLGLFASADAIMTRSIQRAC